MATLVHRLRIRSAEADAHAVERRVASQMAAAELSPAALPPGATLVVRRIGELPRWRVHPLGVRPPREWQAAISDRLDGLLRRAVRARRGAIPEDAEAILFFDDAEMLAEMTLDWLAGKLEKRWCWRALHPKGVLTDVLMRAWVERPEYVSAAIAQIAAARRAETFVARLPERILETVTREVVRVFALWRIEPVFERVFLGAAWPAQRPVCPAPPAPSVRPQGPAPESGHEPAAREAPPVRRPVAVVRPRVASILKSRQEFFLEVTRAVSRSPSAARSEVFAEQIAARFTDDPGPEITPPRMPDPAARQVESAPCPKGETGQLDRIGESTVLQNPSFPEKSNDEFGQSARFSVDGPTLFPSPSVESHGFEGVEIQTEFGGVFYLINLAIYLGYYGDFSTPQEPGIDLPLWDFLSLLARELAGKAVLEDPVWPFLRTLGEGQPWEELHEAVARIREWIVRAMPEIEEPVARVLRHAARVRLTGARLDIFLSLEELPIEIRLARLDRDPGWVPAAGRFVAFHFR